MVRRLAALVLALLPSLALADRPADPARPAPVAAAAELGALRVKVVDDRGQAIAGAFIRVEREGCDDIDCEEAADLSRLPAGSYRVLVSHPAYGAVRVSATVKARSTTTVAVELRPGMGVSAP